MPLYLVSETVKKLLGVCLGKLALQNYNAETRNLHPYGPVLTVNKIPLQPQQIRNLSGRFLFFRNKIEIWPNRRWQRSVTPERINQNSRTRRHGHIVFWGFYTFFSLRIYLDYHALKRALINRILSIIYACYVTPDLTI